MAAPEQVIPGLSDLSTFTRILDFVGNREKYDKRIAHLEEKTQECNTAVRRVVALNALAGLTAQVKKDKQAAEALLATAKQDAEEMLGAAQDRADNVVAETLDAKEAQRLYTIAEDDRLSRWEKELDRREETTNAKKNASEAELVRAETLNETGLALKERYGNALEALTKITNEV